MRRNSFLVLLFPVVLIGCGPSGQRRIDSPPVDLSAIRQQHEAIRERTGQRFERAAFFSPDPDTTPGELRWMSPLIVEQLDPSQAETMSRSGFGRLIFERSGQATVKLDEPTVYHTSTTVEVDGVDRLQSTYLWFFAPKETGEELGWRGFRMLLDHRGFAMVWETLSSDETLRIFYVSKPVEDAAERQYGSPFPGRRYCVEPSLEKHPEVLVARVVGDGPQPMGPFLYLDHPDCRVTNLICRCEPSQVDLFPHSRLYRLADFDDIPERLETGGRFGGSVVSPLPMATDLPLRVTNRVQNRAINGPRPMGDASPLLLRLLQVRGFSPITTGGFHGRRSKGG